MDPRSLERHLSSGGTTFRVAAPAAVEGRRHADLDAELIGFVGLAFANALDLRSMQRVELPATFLGRVDGRLTYNALIGKVQ